MSLGADSRRVTPSSQALLWVGIGCQRGTSSTVIEYAIREVFQFYPLSEKNIAGIATIDRRADEPGLVQFCRDRNLPLRCFSATELASVAVPNVSKRVGAEVGTPSVAEAASLCAASGFFIAEAQGRRDPDRLSALPRLCGEKKVFRLAGQPGSVTIAVAQVGQEFP